MPIGESGVCYCGKQQFKNALNAFKQSVSLNPRDAVSQRWLGYALYRMQNYDAAAVALDEALKLRPNDFDAHYWLGLSSLRALRFEEASRELGKAAELRPSDFNANFWRGVSFLRAHKFLEAIPSLEKAREIRPQDKASRVELFACYLATQQYQRAFQVFPAAAGILGGGLTFMYIVGLALLLPFSLRVRATVFPGLRFSFAWLVLFIVGQAAFPLLLVFFPPFGLNESIFTGLMLAGVPIIIVAATGFARQPWGAPFQLPLQFGTRRTMAIALTLLFLLFLINATVSQIYVVITHKPLPLPHSIPLVQQALQTNPLLAWLAVPLVIPVVEEILFRGLVLRSF